MLITAQILCSKCSTHTITAGQMIFEFSIIAISFLYSIVHSIGIEHFTFLCTPIPVPRYLRKPLEHQLISWFKPSLNTLHNSNFKSDIYSNPSIPDILKSAVIAFKSSNPHSLSSYNINSPNFKTPTAFCNQIKDKE